MDTEAQKAAMEKFEDDCVKTDTAVLAPLRKPKKVVERVRHILTKALPRKKGERV